MSDEQNDKETPKKAFGDEMTNCKVCGKEAKKTKIIMHIERNKECKIKCGKELDIMKEKKRKERDQYQINYQESYYSKNKAIIREKNVKRYHENKEKVAQNAKAIQKEIIENLEEDKLQKDILEKERLRKKEYYKKNAEKIKAKSKKQYENEKKVKAKIDQKMLEEDDNSEDSFYEEEDVTNFFKRRVQMRHYKKEWYKNNAEEIRAKRKMLEEDENSEEEYQDEKVEKYLERKQKISMYKKGNYKKKCRKDFEIIQSQQKEGKV